MRTLSIRASILMHLSDTRLFRVNNDLRQILFLQKAKGDAAVDRIVWVK